MGRALPWVAVLIVVCVIVGGAERNRVPIGGPPGPTLSWGNSPARLTTDDLARIASGADDGQELSAWLRQLIPHHGWATRTGDLMVRQGPPAGTRMETADFGWPTEVVWRVRQAQYEDAYACSGPVGRDWGISRGWSWTSSSSSTQAGGLSEMHEQTGTNLPRISMWVCCWLLLGWWLPAWIAAAWARARRGGWRKLRPRTRLAIAGATGLVLGGISLLAPRRDVSIQLHTPTSTWSGAMQNAAGPPIDSNFAADEVAEVLAKKGGVRELAERLLTVLPTDKAGEIVQFGVTIPSPKAMNLVLSGWPEQWLETMVEVRPDPSVRWATGVRVELSAARSGWLGVAVANSEERRVAFVCLAELAPMVLGTWILWHLLRGGAFLFEWRRARRRHARGLCLGCGYDLSGLRTDAAA